MASFSRRFFAKCCENQTTAVAYGGVSCLLSAETTPRCRPRSAQRRWHANQGAATGQLANNLGNLARGIAQLRQDFSEPGDVVVVMSEFGRTSAENGTRGTDHGFGNAMRTDVKAVQERPLSAVPVQ